MSREATLRQSHELRRWGASALLLLPVLLMYLGHFLHDPEHATGFISYDMPFYMSSAREHFDAGEFHWSYGNSQSFRAETSRIYFQPWTLVLGAAQRLTGGDPALIFLLFGLLSGLCCLRLVIALFEDLFGLGSIDRWLILVGLVWGAGLHPLFGVAYALGYGEPVRDFLFIYDPSEGWWFLNLGRNLVLPNEAFFHLLAMGIALTLWRGRYTAALLLLGLIALCHPYTAIHFSLITLAVLTTGGGSSRSPRARWIAGTCAAVIGALLCAYYLLYLPTDFEHRSAYDQHVVFPWLVGIQAWLPAYLLVGILAGARLFPLGMARRPIAPADRFLLVWAAVSFALINHDLVIRATVPAHFTRGYLWTPLYLLGVPTLMRTLQGVRARLAPRRALLASLGLLVFLCSANVIWVLDQAGRGKGVYLSDDERALVSCLDTHAPPNAVLIWKGMLAYYASAYTSLRPLYGHWLHTPFAHQRQDDIDALYHRGGSWLAEWQERNVVLVARADEEIARRLERGELGAVTPICHNGELVAYRR